MYNLSSYTTKGKEKPVNIAKQKGERVHSSADSKFLTLSILQSELRKKEGEIIELEAIGKE